MVNVNRWFPPLLGSPTKKAFAQRRVSTIWLTVKIRLYWSRNLKKVCCAFDNMSLLLTTFSFVNNTWLMWIDDSPHWWGRQKEEPSPSVVCQQYGFLLKSDCIGHVSGWKCVGLVAPPWQSVAKQKNTASFVNNMAYCEKQIVLVM